MNYLSLVEKIALLSDLDKEWLERLIDRALINQPPKKGCGCHVIDPQKQNMIIWPSQNPKHPNDLIVQITNQKMIGMPRIDKRGAKYWKVRSFYEDEESETTPSTSPKLSLKEEMELILKKPMSEQTAEDREKWAKWTANQEKTPPEINNHETNSSNL